jgi:hypothetical protein
VKNVERGTIPRRKIMNASGGGTSAAVHERDYNCSESAGLTRAILTFDRWVCLSFSSEMSTTTVSNTEMSTLFPSLFGTASWYCSASYS